MVRVALDSNTIVGNNCFIHPRLFDTVFQHYLPVSTHDWVYNEKHSVNIWPNPSKDIVYLEFVGGSLPEQIQLVNLQGQIVKVISVISNQNRQILDLHTLHKGLYFIKIDNTFIKVLKE